jgi:hypothetical protein
MDTYEIIVTKISINLDGTPGTRTKVYEQTVDSLDMPSFVAMLNPKPKRTRQTKPKAK